MNLTSLIKSDADLCVKCGLCLPHCPTYVKTRDEGDSPRGRIALMQAMAEDRLAPGGRLAFHLDRCLACRACEQVCPSGVRYGRLIDSARALGIEHLRPRLPARIARHLALGGLISRRRNLELLARVLRLYQRSGLRRLARASGLLRLAGLQRLDGLVPPLAPPGLWKDYYPPPGKTRAQIALFTGCTGSVLDQEALHAAIRMLTACGHGVHVPREQACCGALHMHAGDLAGATELARKNLAAFGALEIDAVIYLASGCGAALTEYDAWPPMDAPAEPQRPRAPAIDICTFLDRMEWPADLALRPLDRRVAVHDPCTLTNVIRAADSPYRLLRRIPGLDIVSLPGNKMCCGAAGSYFLTQPVMADSLRADKIDALRQTGAQVLVTSNIGCALHLAAGIREAGLEIEVLHPVTLLVRQLENRT